MERAPTPLESLEALFAAHCVSLAQAAGKTRPDYSGYQD